MTNTTPRTRIVHAIGIFAACAVCGLAMETDRTNSGLPEPDELAAWVEHREKVFNDVLELQSFRNPAPNIPTIKAKRILELWNTIATELPENDSLRQRMSYIAAKSIEQTDPARAAKIAEGCIHPAWSARLYRKTGKPDDAERMENLVEVQKQKTETFRKQIRHFNGNWESISDWLLGQPVMDRIGFLTSGITDPWIYAGKAGFSGFMAPLPGNVRLRRVMTLYFQPCVEDNFNSIDGELNLAEPILRTTAKAFPEKLGTTYKLLVEAGIGVDHWFNGPLRIPGDWGPTGNALKLTADLLHDARCASGEILAVARIEASKADKADMRCRWMALAAYIEDGHPEMRTDPDAILIEKLNGTEIQRRWAMAWLPNMLAEAAPRTPLKFKTMDVPNTVIANAGKCVTDEDRILLCNAIGTFPPPAGLEQVIHVASERSSNFEVWRNAMDAIGRQYYQSRERPARESDPVIPNPDFVRLLPALRKALYARLSGKLDCNKIMKILAELQDPELDGQIARHLLDRKFEGTTFMQFSAATARFHKHLQWPKTITAFETLGKDRTFSEAAYAARLAKDLREGD